MSISEEERLSRFILDKRQVRQDRTVRHTAFMPYKGDMSTSVFRVSDIEQEAKWHLGQEHVAGPQERYLLGSAEIHANTVYQNHLHVDPDEPPPRHAIICHWPEDPSKVKLLAMELAANAEFYPSPL